MSWTLDIWLGERHARGSFADWPTARTKIVDVLTRVIAHKPMRNMCIERVRESDAATVGAFSIATAEPSMRIVCQAELGSGWKPQRASTTVVEDNNGKDA